ncbi:MAG: DNA primase [Gammaproteobacteria bacterium]|nr:DNA primase [Gammaproteobacteria bacterium]
MAGRIPSPFIDAVLARTDIIELIGTRVPLRKAGKDHKACCPFHEERTPSFTVSATKQFYHCFGCGAHGTAITFLMEYERLGFVEAVTELARRAGLDLPEEGAPVRPAGPDLRPVLADASRYFQEALRRHPAAGRAHDYLKGRGVTGSIAKTFHLGYAPAAWDGLASALSQYDGKTLERAGLVIARDQGGYYDRFRDRIMFPIEDLQGRVIGFGGRVLDRGEPKYLNSPETVLFHKGRELYGLPQAVKAIERERRVVVVEGYMDVIALAQHGITHTVATLGTATTREHLERLFRLCPEVVFCFDGDRAGRDAAWRALEQALSVLRDGRQVTFLFLPEGEDPDTLVRREGLEGFGQRLRRAMELRQFFFDTLSRQVDLTRDDGRARLFELAKPLLSKLPGGALHEIMMTRLAELTGLAGDRVRALAPAPSPLPAHPGRGFRAGFSPKGSPSLVRQAIALLLQAPALIGEVGELPAFDRPGMDVLAALVTLLKTTPGLSTAAVVERFGETEHYQALARLAAWEYPALVADQAQELRAIMDRLSEQARKESTQNRYKELIRKGNLSESEQEELARLAAYRRTGAPDVSR